MEKNGTTGKKPSRWADKTSEQKLFSFESVGKEQYRESVETKSRFDSVKRTHPDRVNGIHRPTLYRHLTARQKRSA